MQMITNNYVELENQSFEDYNEIVIEEGELRQLPDETDHYFDWQTIAIAGAGFAIDAYDIFVIGIILPMIYQVYYPDVNQGPTQFISQHPWWDASLKTTTHLGNIVGQIGFGYLADKLGRSVVYGDEMIIVLISTLGCTFISSIGNINILHWLTFWRFIMGIGMGGDYPQSATITSERSLTHQRGMMIASVFSMQGIGILLGSLISLITLTLFKQSVLMNPKNLDYVWRIIIFLTVIPSTVLLYFRMNMTESKRFQNEQVQNIKLESLNVDQDDTQIELDANFIENYSSFTNWFKIKKNQTRLIACCYNWFVLDIAWYGLTLNQSKILFQIGLHKSVHESIYEQQLEIVIGGLVIALMGTVPGYYFTVYYIEKLGRKPIQIIGFLVISIVLLILSLFWNTIHNSPILFVTLFTISQFFFNFGPNVTTFIYPSELFPTLYRSTCHGISGAFGKFGAIVGVLLINPFFNTHPSLVLFIYSMFMFSGSLVTMIYLPETKNKSLEELSE